ncbi:MAG: CDP-diacylglycerol--glycerol-3-phosphate 3-phosphatidyltransferase [Lachnospiraceae bacterium]|nr:CDP-diacylglycerol--glycerol-3-phosphate 3-phosphatidyltransferase [Lachnospiraceae bacterium]
MAENKAGNEEQTKVKIWNVPNVLTTLRVIMIIPFVLVLLGGNAGWFGENMLVPSLVALGIFVVACITDLLDGKIARKYNLVTNFGKFMDPLADKVLVSSGLICMVAMERIPAWVVIIILAREFIISGFRLVASDAGIVIAASYWGKFKTTFQMILVVMAIIDLSAWVPYYNIAVQVIMYIALALTVISLIDYIVKNKRVIMQ